LAALAASSACACAWVCCPARCRAPRSFVFCFSLRARTHRTHAPPPLYLSRLRLCCRLYRAYLLRASSSLFDSLVLVLSFSLSFACQATGREGGGGRACFVLGGGACSWCLHVVVSRSSRSAYERSTHACTRALLLVKRVSCVCARSPPSRTLSGVSYHHPLSFAAVDHRYARLHTHTRVCHSSPCPNL